MSRRGRRARRANFRLERVEQAVGRVGCSDSTVIGPGSAQRSGDGGSRGEARTGIVGDLLCVFEVDPEPGGVRSGLTARGGHVHGTLLAIPQRHAVHVDRDPGLPSLARFAAWTD